MEGRWKCKLDQRSPFTCESQAFGNSGLPSSSARNWPGSDPNWVEQLQQALGANCEPDAEFFVHCWKEGISAASGELLDRRRRNHDHQQTSTCAVAYFAAAYSSDDFIRLRERTQNATIPPSSSAAEPKARPTDAARSRPGWEFDFTATAVLTLDQACRVLGVTKTSSLSEIKAAYHRLVHTHHPDRLQGQDERTIQAATNRMIFVNQAYGIVCENRSRQPQ